MPDALELFLKEIDRLVKAANPPDNSAPLGPTIELGCLIAREWKDVRPELTKRLTAQSA